MSRRVVIQATIELEVSVLEDYTADQTEFYYNEGTWCADNIVDELVRWRDELRASNRCMCDLVAVKFLREAGD